MKVDENVENGRKVVESGRKQMDAMINLKVEYSINLLDGLHLLILYK